MVRLVSDARMLVRLNFQVTGTAERKLSAYSKLSGRSASDVVRQLVSE